MGASLFKRLLIGASLVVMASATSAQEVIPDFLKDPGLSPNKSYVNQRFNEFIDPFNGALQLHYVDVFYPGNGGFDLKVTRSYNSTSVDSLNPTRGRFDAGIGWTVHFGRVLRMGESSPCRNANTQSMRDNPVLEMPDGGRQIMAATGSTAPLFMTPQRWKVDCTASGYSVYSPDGVRYDMTHMVNVGAGTTDIYAWYATKITDRNGNIATITYAGTANPELRRVTTSDGRQIDFTYLNAGTLNRRINTISTPEKTYTYGYELVPNTSNTYYLTSVTRPDGLSWEYSYNGFTNDVAGGYLINQVKYPQGGTINYAYDFLKDYDPALPNSWLTVVVEKTQSTGGRWMFSYTPGDIGGLDTTIVNGPEGVTTYKHAGPNYASAGTVWTVGLLMSKAIAATANGSPISTETYTWSKLKISSESYSRPGRFSTTRVDTGETNQPILTKRVIAVSGASYSTTYSNFDAYGNARTVVEAGTNGGSRTTTLSHYVNTSKWIINQTQNESFTGSSIAREFDTNGNLTKYTQDGVVTSYTYHPSGDVATKVMPRALTYTYQNYSRGIPLSETHPESVTITRTVSDAGNVLTERNGDGFTTTYTYDGLDRPRSVKPPIGNTTTITYAATSRTATRGSLSEVTTYNGFGDVVRVALGGITTNYTVDALGRRTFQSNPGVTVGTSYLYDALGRVTRVTNPDNTTQIITYGAGTKAVRDERSKTTTYGYRAYGDPNQQFLMSITAPVSAANVTITRNSKDLVTSVAQGGVTRNYGYNANYYLTSITHPETGTTTYGRDAAGNMTSRKVATSGTTTYTYDNLNRLKSVTYPTTSTPNVAFDYNKRSLMTSATSTTGTRSYTYNSNGGLLSEALALDALTFNVGYEYNANDQLTAVTYPRSSNKVTYTLDVLGRPTAISGYATAVTYWPSGQVRRITYANGTYTEYEQNSRLWPSRLLVGKSGGAAYLNSTMTYDGAGNVTGVSDSVDAQFSRTNGYDDINRLTSSNAALWGTATWTYDGTGNITREAYPDASRTKTYTYSNNRLNTMNWGGLTATFVYDVYGNMRGSTVATTATYDDVPNLRCVSCTATQGVAFTYDAKNFRSSVRKGAITTYEMYGNNGNLLSEFTPSQANQLVEYIYLGNRRIAQRVTP